MLSCSFAAVVVAVAVLVVVTPLIHPLSLLLRPFPLPVLSKYFASLTAHLNVAFWKHQERLTWLWDS